jgi:hypothetical protein
MATPDQIALLRVMINEPNNEAPYTDDLLGAAIDAATSLNAAAASIWEAKAASVAHLVDISEGGSSRKMGDVYEQYLKMASMYNDKDDASGTTNGRVSMTREITRA